MGDYLPVSRPLPLLPEVLRLIFIEGPESPPSRVPREDLESGAANRESPVDGLVDAIRDGNVKTEERPALQVSTSKD